MQHTVVYIPATAAAVAEKYIVASKQEAQISVVGGGLKRIIEFPK